MSQVRTKRKRGAAWMPPELHAHHHSPTSGRLRALRDGLLPHARAHRGVLARGLMYTWLVVGARLALPLPLTAVVDRSATATPGPAVSVGLLSAAFVALALVTGMAEHHQRLAFAHFAGRSVGDAREAALARVQSTADDSTDLTTAVISDSARLKQGLKGVLNHVTVNGLLVAGVCAALAATDLRLGLVQLAGTVVLVLVSVAGAVQVKALAARHRGHETDLAASVNALMAARTSAEDTAGVAALHRLDDQVSEAEIAITSSEGLTTCAAHAVLIATAATVLVLGLDSVNDEAMSVSTLFAALAYLLVLHGPAVRLARQISRVGPLMVSARQLGSVLTTP
jgi:ABC-type bacteriocin/lantibiotic exporter with double-glycine peptidase domain